MFCLYFYICIFATLANVNIFIIGQNNKPNARIQVEMRDKTINVWPFWLFVLIYQEVDWFSSIYLFIVVVVFRSLVISRKKTITLYCVWNNKSQLSNVHVIGNLKPERDARLPVASNWIQEKVVSPSAHSQMKLLCQTSIS